MTLNGSRKALVLLVLLVANSRGLLAERLDPPNEAEPLAIATLLRSTNRVAVFCGDDADMQTCRFFASALAHDLKIEDVAVGLFYQPERLVQSFYVPPIPIPFTGVTVRLIEAENGPRGAVRVYVSGFCFDQHKPDSTGYRLPIWFETESARETGPLGSEEAAAASKLAREFAAYWIKPTRPRRSHSAHAKGQRR